MKRSVWKMLAAVLFSLVLLGAAWRLVHIWLYAGSTSIRAACIYSESSAWALDYEAVAAQLNESGLETAVCVTEDVLSEAKAQLSDGVSVLVLGLDQAGPDAALLEAAAAQQADLFLVGEHPGDNYLDAYDKVYYIGSRAAYAGELAGQATALAYRGGGIPDLTGNLLLDYLPAGGGSAAADTMLEYALQECEHYGVYTQSCLPQYSEEAEAELEADAAEAETEPEPELPAGLSEGAAALAFAWRGLETEPEVIYCMDLPALEAAQEYAAYAGWTERETPVAYVAFTANKGQAQQAVSRGCGTVIYYDGEAIGRCAVQMIRNLTQQTYIAANTGLSPDSHAALWVPYQVYRSAADHLPTPAPSPDGSDSSAAA